MSTTEVGILDGRWQAADLSAITGAPPLAGGLTAYLAPWGGINLAGIDRSGNVSVTWWVPEFGSQWLQSNLTAQFDAPQLRADSLASYVTPWGGLNIVGMAADRRPVVYWWVPGFNDRWEVSDIAVGLPAPPFRAQLEGVTTELGVINIVGAGDNGHVLRLWWRPDRDIWQFQDLTAAAERW